ncbi:MAG: hybrid sensor histidine kinase/response regulator [Anaerolinea sp.]|nr:hybrid sensor histidine kinase/response regulator [Anaerolinea sp.]MCC6972984.1 hybrid sensor histidine kinase/response regulator [Anaerolineae bacterium]CAG1013926.1 two-component system, OmpR family, phosphate regulon sensor histidine kinase PhoR [Anaerolineae bacterium]
MRDKPCVVYIEDDTPSRVLVQVVLSQDFEIHTAANGLEGLNLVRRHQPDIVLTDLNLPDLHGEMIAARIRGSVQHEIPIIALTSDNSREAKHRSIAAGCTGFLTKPIQALTFAQTVREYLTGKVDKINDADLRRATTTIQANMTAKIEDTLRQLRDDNAMLRGIDRAKNAFLTQVSHELRTPLTVLSGYVQMLNQMLIPGAVVGDFHIEMGKKLTEGTRRLQSLINEIVLMSRVASNQFEVRFAPLRVIDALQSALQEYIEPAAARRLTIEQSGVWNELIMGDSGLMHMALSNLISNAIKATPDGGKISLTASVEEANLHLIVADTGIGISADDLPLLFKPFYTTIDVSRGKTSKTDFKGMGLGMGLTLITRIIESHKGQIWAESPGLDEKTLPGSKFHILLPLAPGRAPEGNS